MHVMICTNVHTKKVKWPTSNKEFFVLTKRTIWVKLQ